uniref:Uncharacterized protein n=1 Tax=Aegilops tauschii subsp. strangulata TaxID=200361 RepID=A0A453PDW5_AEGTS
HRSPLRARCPSAGDAEDGTAIPPCVLLLLPGLPLPRAVGIVWGVRFLFASYWVVGVLGSRTCIVSHRGSRGLRDSLVLLVCCWRKCVQGIFVQLA